jgi:hypothetical protein
MTMSDVAVPMDSVPESRAGRKRALPRLERLIGDMHIRIARRRQHVTELESSIQDDIARVTHLEMEHDELMQETP